MTEQQKQRQPQPGGQDPHPETKRHESAKVPDDKSSKVAPDKQGDPRTSHDKDGNERQRSPKQPS